MNTLEVGSAVSTSRLAYVLAELEYQGFMETRQILMLVDRLGIRTEYLKYVDGVR